MVYVFEYFSVGSDGQRRAIEHETRRIANLAEAERRVMATLKYVTFRGERADLCVIKDNKGSILKEVGIHN
jgi:hypothetical protein